MKLTVFFLAVAIFSVQAKGVGQQVTISGKNLTLEQVFTVVEKQTGYVFFNNKRDLKGLKTVSISVVEFPLTQLLDVVFEHQPLKYSIEGKTIFLSRKVPTSLEREDFPQSAIPITGKVTDSTGIPLFGATVTVKNKKVSGQTDAAGKFTLDVVEGDVLLVSFVGYESKTIVVNAVMLRGGNDFAIVLNPLSSQLEEVEISVSTGYQRLPKERVTGSFKVIRGEQLDKPASSLSQRLVGTTSGAVATIDPATGAASFQIRGLSTLGANASPLIVVDGFAVNETDFSQINPNTVESVVFLKDAAAGSIWGARAANGVIVVTTKSGKKSTRLSVNASVFTQIASKIDVNYVRGFADSRQTVDYEVNTFGKFGSAFTTNAISSLAFTRSQAGMLLNENRLGFITTEQMNAGLDALRSQDNSGQIKDLLLANPATTQANLSLSGGTENMTNNFTLLYEKNQFDFKGTDNDKVQINYRTTANLTKWLDFDASIMGQSVKANNNGYTVSDLRTWSPYDVFVNADGSYTNIPTGTFGEGWYYPMLYRFVPTDKFTYSDWTYNPVVDLRTRNVTSNTMNARVQGGLTIKVLKGVSLRSSIQYDNFNVFNRGYYDENSYRVRRSVNVYTSWDQTANGTITALIPKGAQLDQSRTRAEGYTWRNQLNVDRSFGLDHELNIVLGTEATQRVSEGFTHPTTYGYNDVTLAVGGYTNGIGGSYPLQPGYRISTWQSPTRVASIPNVYNSFSYAADKFVSFFGNAAYTYKEKYSLSGSVRSDASNLITDDPSLRYEPFWSVGARWNMSRENFISQIKWLDDLNVRATFGYQGNIDRSTSFLPLLSIGSVVSPITGVSTNTISSYGNPTLRWERTAVSNIGIDFSLFKHKLFGNLEFYKKNSSDLIVAMSIPAANGTSSQRLNNGEMTNTGVNLELGTAQKITADLVWTGSVNLAYNHNKVTSFFLATYQYNNIPLGSMFVEGYNANEIWSVGYAGLDANGYPQVYAGPGKTPIRISTNAFTTGDPRSYVKASGTTVSPYSLGFINSFKYKSLNLSFILTGKFGGVYKATAFNKPFQTQNGRVLPNSRLSYAMNSDPNTYIPLPTVHPDPVVTNWQNWASNMDYLIERADVIRMQEVNLSYDFGRALKSRMGLKDFSAYVQGNNLFIINNNRYNEDPEYIEGTLRPRPRLIFGFKVKF
ncbi:MAG: SusC/RagA family TonB-linked outer membrane protein [Chitinophagaceae bacterium]